MQDRIDERLCSMASIKFNVGTKSTTASIPMVDLLTELYGQDEAEIIIDRIVSDDSVLFDGMHMPKITIEQLISAGQLRNDQIDALKACIAGRDGWKVSISIK